ncbi:MAG TPA: hypothetical protein VIK61_13315 [Acidimicrobiia bacterium]
MNFYDEVLRELVTVLGAALFVANAWALARRKVDAEVAVRRTVARSRPGSPVRGYRRDAAGGDLVQAPIARSIIYLLIGLVVMIWGIASLVSG